MVKSVTPAAQSTRRTVIVSKSTIDRRPFRSKSEREHEEALENKYRSVAIPEVVAALGKPKPADAVKVA